MNSPNVWVNGSDTLFLTGSQWWRHGTGEITFSRLCDTFNLLLTGCEKKTKEM